MEPQMDLRSAKPTATSKDESSELHLEMSTENPTAKPRDTGLEPLTELLTEEHVGLTTEKL